MHSCTRAVPEDPGNARRDADMWQVSKGATLRYPHPGAPDERRRRFEEVYAANCGPILGYVLRRTDNPDDAADVGYLREQIVINPKTYAYMGYIDIAVRAHSSTGLDGTAHFRKGQILGWQALLGSGIVQRPGQLP